MVLETRFAAQIPEIMPACSPGATWLPTRYPAGAGPKNIGERRNLEPKIGEIPDAWNRRCIPYRFYPLYLGSGGTGALKR